MPKKIKNVFFKSLTFQKFLEAHNRAKKNKMYKNRIHLFKKDKKIISEKEYLSNFFNKKP